MPYKKNPTHRQIIDWHGFRFLKGQSPPFVGSVSTEDYRSCGENQRTKLALGFLKKAKSEGAAQVELFWYMLFPQSS